MTTSTLTLQQLKDVRELCLPGTAWRSILDELIAIRELKGEQVPMFLKQTGIGSNGCQGSYKEYVTIDESEYEENPVKHLKLFTAPQKPVVLPEGFWADEGWVIDYAEAVAAIEAAGGTVKEGE